MGGLAKPIWGCRVRTAMTDEWSGLVDMSANMSGEYVSDLDIENLPDMTVGNHAEDERNVAGKDLKDASCE